MWTIGGVLKPGLGTSRGILKALQNKKSTGSLSCAFSHVTQQLPNPMDTVWGLPDPRPRLIKTRFFQVTAHMSNPMGTVWGLPQLQTHSQLHDVVVISTRCQSCRHAVSLRQALLFWLIRCLHNQTCHKKIWMNNCCVDILPKETTRHNHVLL